MTEEQVFLAALDLASPDDRAAYLEKACGGNVEFRRQVEELLAAHFKAGAFLDEPVGMQMGAGLAFPIRDRIAGQRANPRGEAAADEVKPEEADDLHFLQPSTRPGSLGRIGHYEVLEVLGKGGFGIVFRAFDDVLQRVVAVKVLAPAMAATSPARKRFLREARSSAQVRHENVVQVYAVEEQPLPYLVMEFIPGETLQQRLDRTGPLEAPEIVRLGRQIAEGLAAAHATGLIHRDIKPGNVLIEGGPQRRVKITDFGLARAADDASLTQSGVLAGTPMYMAPEQAKGETLDHRADLFSLGSVLYVMATGRPPFRAATTYAVLKRVVEDAPRPIREVIPEMPQWLCDIIAKLHAKKPEDRFQSAREVADVLADCEAQLTANAKSKDFSPIPRSQPAVGRAGRWKWVRGRSPLAPRLRPDADGDRREGALVAGSAIDARPRKGCSTGPDVRARAQGTALGFHQHAGHEVQAHPGRQVHDGVVAGRNRPFPRHIRGRKCWIVCFGAKARSTRWRSRSPSTWAPRKSRSGSIGSSSKPSRSTTSAMIAGESRGFTRPTIIRWSGFPGRMPSISAAG